MHLRKAGSTLSPAQAATAAIRSWVKAQEQPAATAGAASSQGYQWKDLFLPEGTDLRMSTAGATYHARVEGDHIVYRGRQLSPRGLTVAIAGDGRNAWRDLYLRFPGERCFLPASRCRREHQQERERQRNLATSAPAAAPSASPADSLNAAALAMAEVLKTTLALLDRTSVRAMQVDERRVTGSRREIDILADQCAFD